MNGIVLGENHILGRLPSQLGVTLPTIALRAVPSRWQSRVVPAWSTRVVCLRAQQSHGWIRAEGRVYGVAECGDGKARISYSARIRG